MYLPNKDQAVVEREKVRDYLLSEAHPDGHGKAEFLDRKGTGSPCFVLDRQPGSYFNDLGDSGMSYRDYVEQLTIPFQRLSAGEL